MSTAETTQRGSRGRPAWWARTGDPWETGGDVFAAFLVGMLLWGHDIPSAPAAVVLLVLVLGCLTARRRHSLAAACTSTVLVAVAGFTWTQPANYSIIMFAFSQLCLLSVALRHSRRTALVVAAVLGATLYVQSLVTSSDVAAAVDLRGLLYLTWTAAVVGAGLAVRAQRDYVGSLEARHRATEEDREKEVARRITQERLRIARDLHDSVAHNISVISVHAGSAERSMVSAPETAATSLTAIRAASRTVLAEMQQILQVLRDDDALERTVPGMAAVPLLLTTLRASGLQVWYESTPESIDLSPTVDLTVYRFLQEALTNASRYSDGTAKVTISGEERAVRVSVTNRRGLTNRPSATVGQTRTSGYGLVGMRERVTSAGGELRIEQDPAEFSVTATFPQSPTRGPEHD